MASRDRKRLDDDVFVETSAKTGHRTVCTAEPPIGAGIERVAVAAITTEGNNMSTFTPSVSLERELAQLIITALNLKVPSDAIESDTQIFGAGLGLDSIDGLELALEISSRYGFELRADDDDNMKIFASLKSLADYVAVHRTK
jgi:acyl carrier protein